MSPVARFLFRKSTHYMQYKPPSTALSFIIPPMMAFQLLFIYTESNLAFYAVTALVLSIPVLSVRSLRLREFYVLAASVMLVTLAFVSLNNPWEVVAKGLERAGFLANFILLMGVMRNAALTSPAILECGRYVTKQKPQRRFLGVMFGSHFFSSLLNLGALSLLVPIVQRGLRGDKNPDEPLDEITLIKERRQITAMLRGFAWFLIWAPTAVTQAVLPTLLTGVDMIRLMITGAIIAFVMMMVAWGEDMIRWRPLKKRLMAAGKYPAQVTPEFPAKAVLDFMTVVVVLISLSLLFKWLGQVNFISGVMLAAPVILVGWVYVQAPEGSTKSRTAYVASRTKQLAQYDLPAGVREIVSFTAAGFIGTLAAYLIPTEYFSAALNIYSLPQWLVLLELTLCVWVAGQVGLSPVTMAVFLGSAVAEVQNLPIDVTWAALAIACGAAISTLGAPFAAGILMLSRVSGYEPSTLSWKWNLLYTSICFCVLAVFYVVLSI